MIVLYGLMLLLFGGGLGYAALGFAGPPHLPLFFVVLFIVMALFFVLAGIEVIKETWFD